MILFSSLGRGEEVTSAMAMACAEHLHRVNERTSVYYLIVYSTTHIQCIDKDIFIILPLAWVSEM